MSANPYEAPTSELAAPELRATRRSHLKDRAKLLLLGFALCLVCLVFLVMLVRSGLSLEWSFIALFAVQSALIILYASWKVRRRASSTVSDVERSRDRSTTVETSCHEMK